MVAGPIQAFTRDNIKARWTERYTSDAVNKKFLGLPRGIYLGFVPSSVGLILDLKPDKALTYTGLSGVWAVGDVITGGSSTATATVRVVSSGYVLVDTITGTFQNGEALSGGAGIATLNEFIDEGISLGRVVSSSALSLGRSEHMLDVFTTDIVSLDFTGFDPGTYYVILTATFAVGATTVGSILTRTTPPPSGAQEVLVCIVTKAGANLTVAATAPISRHEPHAFDGTRIGFMPGGSIESLILAVSGTQEVTASRRGTDGTAPVVFDQAFPQTTGLPLRLNTDLSNYGMGGRLGKRLSAVQGNRFTLASPDFEKNVSGSFSSRTRDSEPYRDLSPSTGILIPPGIQPAIEASGSDTVELTLSGVIGAFTVGLPITGGTSGATAIIKSFVGTTMTVSDFVGSLFSGEPISQAVPVATATIASINLSEGAVTGLTAATTDNNVCNIIDAATGRRAVDAAGNVVFGRLVYGPGGASTPGELTLAAGQQLNFTASTTTVLSLTGNIVNPADLGIGDLVEGDDGRFYEVLSIIGNPITSFELPPTKDYVGPTAVNVGGLRRRRFNLEFKFIASGVESVATLPAGDYDFFFPAWFTLEKSNLSEVMQANPPGNSLIADGITTDISRAPATTDDRIGQVYGAANGVATAPDNRRPRIDLAASTGIEVLVADSGNRLTFTIRNTAPATGGSAPPNGAAGGDLGGFYPTPTVLFSNGLAIGLASKDGINVVSTTVAATLADIIVPTNGKIPRLAIWVGGDLNDHSIGIARGDQAQHQQSLTFDTGGNATIASAQNMFNEVFGPTRWVVNTFNTTNVIMTKTAGVAPMTGTLFVITDNAI